jgi:hypothetical protein
MKQISDDDVTFLQLNSKDASLFVYKKLFFHIKPTSSTLPVNYPTKSIYDKMMMFFSLISENDFMINGDLTNENWWKCTFVEKWDKFMANDSKA